MSPVFLIEPFDVFRRFAVNLAIFAVPSYIITLLIAHHIGLGLFVVFCLPLTILLAVYVTPALLGFVGCLLSTAFILAVVAGLTYWESQSLSKLPKIAAFVLGLANALSLPVLVPYLA